MTIAVQRLTDEVSAAKRTCLKEPSQGPQDIKLPAMFNLRLTKGDNGPKYLERGKQEWCPAMVSFSPLDE
jgi:hypothetical protein